MFAPVQAPKLTNTSGRAIQDFLADQKQYEVAIKAQPGVSPILWAGCFDALFLRSLVRARALGTHYKSAGELIDAIIKAKRKSLSYMTKNVFPRGYGRRYTKHEDKCIQNDARLHIIMRQTSYFSLCMSSGWHIIKKAQKAAVKHFTAVLQPPQLKARVEKAHRLEKRDLKDDFFGFANFYPMKQRSASSSSRKKATVSIWTSKRAANVRRSHRCQVTHGIPSTEVHHPQTKTSQRKARKVRKSFRRV